VLLCIIENLGSCVLVWSQICLFCPANSYDHCHAKLSHRSWHEQISNQAKLCHSVVTVCVCVCGQHQRTSALLSPCRLQWDTIVWQFAWLLQFTYVDRCHSYLTSLVMFPCVPAHQGGKVQKAGKIKWKCRLK
jgi:hypothetical protein